MDDIALIEEMADRIWMRLERARIEEALQSSEEGYRNLFETIDEGFSIVELLHDTDGNPVDWRYLAANPNVERQATTTVVGKTIRELVGTADPVWLSFLQDVFETGKPARIETKSESLGRWFRGFASRIEDSAGHIALVSDDITDAKETEEALRKNEERQTFLLSLDDALRPLADPGDIQETAVRMLGEQLVADWTYYGEADSNFDSMIIRREFANDGVPSLVGRHPVTSVDILDKLQLGITVVVDDFRSSSLISRGARQHFGNFGMQAVLAVPIVKNPGRLLAAVIVASRQPRHWSRDEIKLVTDVADRTWMAVEKAHADVAVRSSEERFRAVANVVPDLLWQSDQTGATMWFNDRWYAYTGQPRNPVTGWEWSDYVHRDDRETTLRQYYRSMARFEKMQTEYRLRAADGSYRWFLIRIEPFFDDEGMLVAWFGAATDIHDERTVRSELASEVKEATAALRSLSRRLILVQEEERRSIARELHDEVGQMLTGLSFILSGTPLSDENQIEAQHIVMELTDQVRQLSMNLRPAALDAYGLLSAIRSHLDRFETQTGIAIELRLDNADRRFPTPVEIAAYRVVQESLTNMARHAETTFGVVQLVADTETLYISIHDGGKGFDPDAVVEGSGIGGMRERVELLGGRFDIDSRAGGGVAITAELPLINRKSLDRADPESVRRGGDT